MVNSKGNPRARSSAHQGGSTNLNTNIGFNSKSSSSYEDLRLDASRGVAANRGVAGTHSNSYDTMSAAMKASRKRRKRKKIITGVLVGVLVLLLVGGGAAFGYLNYLNGNLHKGITDQLKNVLSPVDTPTDPFYVLLLGTDGSAARDEDEEFAGTSYRSDSIMLARVDPQSKKVVIISIPRDTRVDLGEYGYQKINAALAFGGAELAVEAVSKLAGVPISHYAEINFDGFADIVNTLGGIEVDVPMTIDDDEAGGYLAAGLQTLDGGQALILCRSRHAYDEYGAGDLYRAANQRLVLSAIAQKVLDADVATIASTVTALSQYVTTDMDVQDIVAVAQTLKGINASDDIYSAVAPTTSEYIDEISYQILDEDEWKEMIDRVNQGLPPTEADEIDELTGTVLSNAGGATSDSVKIDSGASINVRNGSDTSGLAAQAQVYLEEMGYSTIDVGNADADDYTTTLILYKESDDSAQAQAMAAKFGVGQPQLDDGTTYLFESDFLIIIGSDWVSVHPTASSSSTSTSSN
jgi:LCP family protein required for cell wall assembly